MEKVDAKQKIPDVLEVIDKMDGDASGLLAPEDFAAAAVIDSYDNTTITNAFATLRGLAKSTFNEMAQKGQPVISDQENRIKKVIDSVAYINIQISPNTNAVKVPIVNANVQHFGRQISEQLVNLGQKDNGPGLAMAWTVKPNGAVSVSLRSNGQPDLSSVIEHLRNTMNITGGGHGGAGAIHFKNIIDFAKHMMPKDAPQCQKKKRVTTVKANRKSS